MKVPLIFAGKRLETARQLLVKAGDEVLTRSIASWTSAAQDAQLAARELSSVWRVSHWGDTAGRYGDWLAEAADDVLRAPSAKAAKVLRVRINSSEAAADSALRSLHSDPWSGSGKGIFGSIV